jgi:hypothetical protein
MVLRVALPIMISSLARTRLDGASVAPEGPTVRSKLQD